MMAGARQFDERQVIETALGVFRRKGLGEATMQDLAAATGVQRGSLYNAYGDKEAIFVLAYDRYAREFLETARSSLARGDAATRLQAFLDNLIDNMTRGSPQCGCLTTRTVVDGAMSTDAIRRRVQTLLGELEKLIAEAIRVTFDNPPDRDSARLARVVLTFTRGLAVMERAGHTRSQLKGNAKVFVDALTRNVSKGERRK